MTVLPGPGLSKSRSQWKARRVVLEPLSWLVRPIELFKLIGFDGTDGPADTEDHRCRFSEGAKSSDDIMRRCLRRRLSTSDKYLLGRRKVGQRKSAVYAIQGVLVCWLRGVSLLSNVYADKLNDDIQHLNRKTGASTESNCHVEIHVIRLVSPMPSWSSVNEV